MGQAVAFAVPGETFLDASDAELVRRCLAGERTAWAGILERYGDLVYGLAYRAGHDRSSSADVFQEVSIRLWKSLPRLRRKDSLAPWLATTAKRVAWRMRARSRSSAEREKAMARDESDEASEPSGSLASLEEEQTVRRALGALGERCRRLLRALYFESSSASYDDVATRLGIPRGSIGPTRQRCLARLREELERAGFRVPDVSTRPPEGSSQREE